MAKTIRVATIIGVVISLILVGVLLPIGLPDLINYDGTYTNASGSVIGTNTTVATLVSSVLPIMAVVGLVMAFVSYRATR